MAGQDTAQHFNRPCFERFAHQGMVGIGKNLLCKRPCLFERNALFIDKNADQFGNGQNRMCIVQMDRDCFSQIVKARMIELVTADEILQTRRHKEIFLHQAQFPARGRRVIRIEHTGHVLRHVFRFNSSGIIALVESGQIDFRRRLGRPQAQSRCTFSVIPRDNGIVRHRQNAMGIHPACPAILLFDMTAIPYIEL